MSPYSGMDEIRKCGWYWGAMSPQEAIELLDEKPEGSFIVRDSTDKRYIFTLSVKTLTDVVHIRIAHQNGRFTLGFPYSGDLSDHHSGSLADLINFLIINSQTHNHELPSSSSSEISAANPLKFFLKPETSENGLGRPSEQIRLMFPISRFTLVPSLKHLCRFEILRHVRRDNIAKLPLPRSIKLYLKDPKNIVEYR